MTEQPSNLPVKGARLESRGSYLTVVFHPSLRLTRKRGFEFAAKLSQYIEPTNVELDEKQWRFDQPLEGSTRGRFKIIVDEQRIQIGAEFPEKTPAEWLESRRAEILNRFREMFKLKIVIQSAALIRATIPVEGDARTFLADHVMHLKREQISTFDRPIHMVGLKFALPPFIRKGLHPRQEDWFLEVSAESLIEDPSKLYIEADGRWQNTPMPWDDVATQTVVDRLVKVSDYVKDHVLEFLIHAEGGE